MNFWDVICLLISTIGWAAAAVGILVWIGLGYILFRGWLAYRKNDIIDIDGG